MAGSNGNLYFAASVICMTALLFGYSVGFIGGVLVLPSFQHHFLLGGLPANELASAQAGTVTSWLVGTLAGVLTAMPIYSRLGRRSCLFFSALLYIAGATVQVGSGTGRINIFDFGRFINGIGVGAGTLVSPLYISEISTRSTRGKLMSSYQVGVQLSALIGFWCAYLAHETFHDNSARQYLVPVSIQLVPAILLVAGIFFIPEAPTFLAENGDKAYLTASISWLRGLAPSSPTVTSEVQIMLQAVSVDRRRSMHQRPFLAEVYTKPSLRRRLAVGIGLMVAQNMAGLNAINYYAPAIFQSAGFTSVGAMLFLSGLFGVTKLFAAAAFMFLFVRVRGNRFWLNLGSAVCAGSMFVLAFSIWHMSPDSPSRPVIHSDFASVEDHNGTTSLGGIVSVLCVYIFAFFFGVSLGPISWNVCGEIFPARLSAKCCAITTFTQWVFQIVIASITPKLIATVGWGTYVFYGLCCTVSLLWCWMVVPETRGVALGRDMDALFEKKEEEGTVIAETERLDEAMSEVEETSPLLRTSQRSRRRSSIALTV